VSASTPDTARTTEELRFRELTAEVSVIRQRGLSGLAVNLYLLRGGGGPTSLVDTGYPGQLDDVERTLEAMGTSLGSVERVFYTHTHIDHMGAGPDWTGRSEAEHLVAPGCEEAARAWDRVEAGRTRWRPWVEEAVDEPELRDLLAPAGRTPSTRARGPIPNLRVSRPGERVAAGPFALEWVPAPGHDPAHVVWFDRERRVAFSGDVVLPIPTPIVRQIGDDTATYLETLDRLAALDVDVAYPGHGMPAPSWAARVAKSREFVEARNEAIVRALEGGERSLIEVARALLPDSAAGLSQLFLTLANVESSVQYLASLGRVVRKGARIRLPS
jgi:glyoxylase-like metal-dependent hydrolase (beta-lactamase superfamily II)